MSLSRIPLTKKDLAWVKSTPTQLQKTFDSIHTKAKEQIEQIKATPIKERTFANTPLAIAKLIHGTSEDNFFSLLANVSTTATVIEKAEKLEAATGDLHNDLAANTNLYNALKEYLKSNFKKEKKTLSKPDIKLANDLLEAFVHNGLELNAAKQKEAKKLKKQINKLQLAFQKHLRNYTDHILIQKEDLTDLPESLIGQLEKTKEGYKVTLDYPIAYPFLRFCPNPVLRKKLTDKLAAKGGKPNLKRMTKLVELRQKLGKIMGYKTFAEYQIKPKMAQDAAEVIDFTMDIISKTKQKQKQEFKELQNYKRKVAGNKSAIIEYFDESFYTNKMVKELFDYDPEITRQYFPLEKVISGTFDLMKKIFGLNFKATDLPAWHKDVTIYEASNGNQTIGYIALDLHPRAKKYGHVCMFPLIGVQESEPGSGETTAPLSAMLGQFPKPTKKQPSLLSFREVQTFLHEFGHIMHHTMAQTKHGSQAGTNTAFDFVELPSQMFENWISSYEVVKKFSSHYETGKSMPKELFEKIKTLSKYRQATQYNSQAITQLFDMEIHSKKSIKDLNKHWRSLQKKHSGIELMSPKSLFPANFGHIANDLYVAGYYGYMWARVYAQDCFSVFQKQGVLSRSVGKKFEEEILSLGASRPEMTSLKKFLGRKPNAKAFLDWAGI